MNLVRKLLLLLMCNLVFFNLLAQRTNEALLSRLDSILMSTRKYCDGVTSSQIISKRKIKRDKKTVKFLNDFYKKDLSIGQIEGMLTEVNNREWPFNEVSDFGDYKIYKRNATKDGNLRVEIIIATFKEQIVAKRARIETRSMLVCPDNHYAHHYDIFYLRKHIVPEFKMNLIDENVWIQFDTTHVDRLVSLSPDYRILLTGDSSQFFNDLTWFTIDSYVLKPRMNPVVDLYRSNVGAIEKLLYSPNHIIAIYAYEALMKAKVPLSEKTIEQMNKVLNSPIKIKWWSHDLGYSGKTYKELMGL